MAVTLEDVLGRRVPLLLMSRDQGLGAAPLVAERMASLLGWDNAAKEQRLAEYRKTVEASRKFRED